MFACRKTKHLASGDSGGPVFKTTTGARNTQQSEIFGVVIFKLGFNTVMCELTHKIMNELDLRPWH